MPLTPATWQRLQALFHQACALPEPQRAAFAQAQAGDDPELLHELLGLLTADSRATELPRPGLLGTLLGGGASATELPAGTRFGPWAIDRVIGRGGMGQVYLGHRADGAYAREVAIKLIAATALDAQQRAVFEFECRLLAQMQHPAIAQIHDAGTDAQGRPYLVMEYIRGEPLTRWCAQRALSLRARIELLVRVGEGVQHAHQKGVIHRDLKPNNVLVGEIDGRPAPSIIDFGIAVETAQPSRNPAGASGTPGYMSPEQAQGDDGGVDARSDVYSLGALLYELICGVRPELFEAGVPEAPSRWIQAQPLPQQRELAQQRGVSLGQLLRGLHDGLDAIVLQAMAPDRAARYASVSSLLDDLRRWLGDYPPRALPRSLRRDARKFVQRNRGTVLASLLVLTALLGGLASTLWSLRNAQREAQRAQVTADFLGSLLSSVDPSVAQDKDKTLLLQVMDQASQRATRELASQPQALVEVELTIGTSLVGLGEYKRAVTQLEAARRHAQAHLGAYSEDELQIMRLLGEALVNVGAPKRAEAILREGIAQVRLRHGADAPLGYDMQSRLSWALRAQGQARAALRESRQAYTGILRVLPADDQSVLSAGDRYAATLADGGDYDQAIALIRDLIARRSARLGADHPLTLSMRNSLAVYLLMKRDYPAAERELKALQPIMIRLYGENGWDTQMIYNNLAGALRQQGKVAESGPYYRKALDSARTRYPEDHPTTIMARTNHAFWLLDDGQAQAAAAEQRAALADAERVLGGKHEVTAEILRGLAEAEIALGQREQARAHAERTRDILVGLYGDAPGPLAQVRETLAKLDAPDAPRSAVVAETK
ncbi:protein kinase domain-containing protein [Xanthomonas tesorieronis]|uniref:serine/threonine-protein kinase n=1 Tax=Xanthomonas tesorieronis TaxID=3160839 RepID=UPI003511F317